MERGRPSWREAALVLFAYTVLTAAMLWPLSMRPWLTQGNEDVYGNAWAMAWVARQAVRDPSRLLDANMYFPVPRALAFTEPLLPEAMAALPLLAAGTGPITAHNVVLLLSFPLSALGAWLLARELGANRGAALVAGIAYGFSAYRLNHLVHVQSLWAQWLPFTLVFLRRAAAEGRVRDLALLAASALLQALSSGYYAVLQALALVVALPFSLRPALRGGHVRGIVLALALSAVPAALLFWPYRAAMRAQEQQRGISMARPIEQTRHWSAHWESYLQPAPQAVLPHHRALRAWAAGAAPLYPSLPVLLLAPIAVIAGWRRREVQLAVALALTGLLFSLGPELKLGPLTVPGPFALISSLPGVSMLRTPSRMGVLAILGLSLLAALAWSRVSRGGRTGWALTGALLAAMVADLYPYGLRYGWQRPDPAPPTVEWLAQAPPGPTLELPWDHETLTSGALYLYWSTRHWQHLVNGWGGFYPKGPLSLGLIGGHFPSTYSSRALRQVGVRYVVVHLDRIPAHRTGWRRRLLDGGPLPPGVRLLADFGWHRVYALDASP